MAAFMYAQFNGLEKQISDAKSYAVTEVANLKSTLSDAKESLVNDYKDIKDKLMIKELEERRSNLAFANQLLDMVQITEAKIVNRNLMVSNQEYTSSEWAGIARMEARIISAVAYDRQEILSALTTTKLGDSWLIQEHGEKRMKLYDWLSNKEPVKERLTSHSTRTP